MRIRPLDIMIAFSIAGVFLFGLVWSPTNAATGPSGLVTQTPVRVLNTRSGPMPAAGIELVVNTGRPGASAVVANITSIGAAAPGQFLTAWASGPRPDTSILNSDVGEVVANSIIVPVAPDGTFRLYTFASAHLLVGPAATLLNGQLGSVWGIPVIVSEHVRQDLNATGVNDGITTTQSYALLVNHREWAIGQREAIDVEVDDSVYRESYQRVAVGFSRQDFQHVGSAAANDDTGILYDLD